jgi:glucose-1-phosphate thymidylyltransferase
VLGFIQGKEDLVAADVVLENSTIHEPCFIGAGCVLRNSEVGPGVSIGAGSQLDSVKINRSIIGENSELKNLDLSNSMIGNKVSFNGRFTNVSIGDFTTLDE